MISAFVRSVWLLALAFLMVSTSAIGQGKCVFEGQEVPCDEWIKKPTTTPAGECTWMDKKIPCEELKGKMKGFVGRVGEAVPEGKCTWDGKEIPCDEMKGKLKGFFGLGIGVAIALGGIALLLGMAAFVLWIMMLVHAASNAIENKVMWIVLMVFIGLPVSVVYYFVVKRNFVPPSVQPPPVAV